MANNLAGEGLRVLSCATGARLTAIEQSNVISPVPAVDPQATVTNVRYRVYKRRRTEPTYADDSAQQCVGFAYEFINSC